MPFSPIILWTDALIYLFVGIVLFLIWHVRQNEHLLAPWKRVGHSASGMSSLTVLLFFLIVGLLDTVHFRPALEHKTHSGETIYSVEVLSLLDLLVTPLRMNVEKTYSAPLATHLYAKETIELPDGNQIRTFARLEYGGARLQNPDTDHVSDITWLSAKGLMIGFLAWCLFTACLVMLLSRRHQENFAQTIAAIWHCTTEIPWRAILITLLILLMIIGCGAALASHYHVLGTDKVGQDILYQSLKSIRIALVIGTLTTLIMLPFALLLGIMAGYFRGWIDDVIQYFYTTLNSIPSVLLIAAAVLMMQVYIETHSELFETFAARADLRLLFLCLILGVTSWTSLCRLLRGEAMKLRELEYIQAAHAFGVSHWRIITRHILPNVMHIVLIATVMDFSGLVLAEAVLSYVGVGVDPSMMSFGTMINAARLEMAREPMVWWALLAAFFFMFTLVLSANLFADAVQNALDPRSRTLKQSRKLFQQPEKKELTPSKISQSITPTGSSQQP
ncbi:ABC transporter permease [Nitrosomonas supralitoralis]|uniref:Peptide ABC transporter permease n=1 Tax=Nitrosomonas supralitoralis TaxID=2116706 RepID=A0A2P7NTB8_9PROT|nr:ABC transporter permease [Nitrosomonas supralitoralis]PSJ16679.1 peptide ABC transporter permease [Nitrosomonas supralitoralis]